MRVFINAVYYGNCLDPSKYVGLHIFVQNDILNIQIIDQVDGFIPEQIADPLEGDNIFRDHGRDIFITSHYSDTVT